MTLTQTETVKNHDDIINDLVKRVDSDKPIKLQFESQNWYWNAYITGPFELDKDVGMQAELTLKVTLLIHTNTQ